MIDYLDPKNPDWNKNKVEEKWKKAVEENDRETMFKCIHRLCYGICITQLTKTGATADDIYEKSLDTAIHAFDRMETPYHKSKGGMHYRTLASWCYFAVIEVLFGKQLQFEEKTASLDSFDSENLLTYF